MANKARSMVTVTLRILFAYNKTDHTKFFLRRVGAEENRAPKYCKFLFLLWEKNYPRMFKKFQRVFCATPGIAPEFYAEMIIWFHVFIFF